MSYHRFVQVRRYTDLTGRSSIRTGTAAAFQSSLQSNRLLSKLRDAYLAQRLKIKDEDSTEALNSPRSLPMTKSPSERIFKQVAQDAKVGRWRKGIVKWFRFGLHMVKYYRDGIKNTYLVAKETRPLVQGYNAKRHLATDLYKKAEFNEIEHRLTKRAGTEPIKLLPLSRKQFVECHRRKEVWKIPSFIFLALLLEELTAVVCYLWPKVALHNCLTPGGFAKIARAHVNEQLDKWETEPVYRSPYTLPEEQVYAKLKSLAVEETPQWKLTLYQVMDNKTIARETLMRTHQYLFVDDWLLLQHTLHQPVTKLAIAELVDCIWLRQLYYRDEDINAMANDPEGQRVLVWRLLIYWAFRYDKTVTSGGGDALFAERWGVNNVSILNYSGQVGGSLVTREELPILDGVQQANEPTTVGKTGGF